MSLRKRTLNPRAKAGLERLKYEVAEELQLDDDINERGWENMTTREVGKIGGNMVKRMISMAENELAAKENSNQNNY